MGRGSGEASSAVATRTRQASARALERLEFKDLREVRKELPASLHYLVSAVIVPVGRRDENGKKILEAARCMMGSDNQVYVLRYRDTYRKRLLGRDELLSQEAAISFKGKSLTAAADAMNTAQDEISVDSYVPLGMLEIGGISASGRSKDARYRVGRLVESLEKLLDSPANDRTQRVLKSFALEV